MMKRILIALALALSCFSVAMAQSGGSGGGGTSGGGGSTGTIPQIGGTWHGYISTPAVQFAQGVMSLVEDASGNISGTLDMGDRHFKSCHFRAGQKRTARFS